MSNVSSIVECAISHKAIYSFEVIGVILRPCGEPTSSVSVLVEASKFIYKGYYIGINGCCCEQHFYTKVSVSH